MFDEKGICCWPRPEFRMPSDAAELGYFGTSSSSSSSSSSQ